MSQETKGTDFFVGLFLLIGFGILAGMVVVFGRLSQGFQKYYPLTIEFPNASGLIKGSDVFLSGARVGTVVQSPQLIGKQYAVAVPLNINATVHFPRTSLFQVRSNGLLGDSYVDITPPPNFTAADLAKPGETIIGNKVGGFEELTSKGGALVDKLNDEVLTKVSSSLDEIRLATTNLNQNFLNARNTKNIEETFANLKEATGNFAKTTRDLDIFIGKAQEAVDSVKITLKTADSSAAELKLALTDLREMANTATRTVDSAKLLINKASSGDGPVGALISDKQMAADLRSLVANLRRSGVLFYKDRPLPAATAPNAVTPAPKSPPKKGR